MAAVELNPSTIPGSTSTLPCPQIVPIASLSAPVVDIWPSTGSVGLPCCHYGSWAQNYDEAGVRAYHTKRIGLWIIFDAIMNWCFLNNGTLYNVWRKKIVASRFQKQFGESRISDAGKEADGNISGNLVHTQTLNCNEWLDHF